MSENSQPCFALPASQDFECFVMLVSEAGPNLACMKLAQDNRPTYFRIGLLADGYVPNIKLSPENDGILECLNRHARETSGKIADHVLKSLPSGYTEVKLNPENIMQFFPHATGPKNATIAELVVNVQPACCGITAGIS